jgi:adenine-specific DNA-methyltransferase
VDPKLATQYPMVQHTSFVTAQDRSSFDLVIGNPPYIRWKNLEDSLKQELEGNSLWNKYLNPLCDYSAIFILKSIESLKENGQLIFICPEYWMNTTHSLPLRNYMVENGFFEEIYHFNETPIFEGACVSLIIFKFIKSAQKHNKKIKLAKYLLQKKLTQVMLQNLKKRTPCEAIEFLEISPFRKNERWLLQPDSIVSELGKLEQVCKVSEPSNALNLFAQNMEPEICRIGDVCDIGNGMVSGLDKAFQIDSSLLNQAELKASIDVAKAKDLVPYWAERTTTYIFAPENLTERDLQSEYPHFYDHLQGYKQDLNSRYMYHKELNYWEWAFLRSYNLFSRNERRILVPCKERISNKDYFRFAFAEAGIYPTQDVTALFKKPETKESLEYILAYLNQPAIFHWLKCNGIVKGSIVEFSEKPTASIPFRKIHWNEPAEVKLHDEITQTTHRYLQTKNDSDRTRLNSLFQTLMGDSNEN